MKRFGIPTHPGHLARQCLQRASGFTLLEVMVAVAIFTIGLLGLGSMQITAIRLNATAQLNAQLAAVAQEQMEDVLIRPYAAPGFVDTDPLIGSATTYCVLYPPEGLRPCKAVVPPAAPYCQVIQQSVGGSQCSDATFAPPTVGYKIQWMVDTNTLNTLAHIDLLVSHKAEGRQQPKTFMLSFAKSIL